MQITHVKSMTVVKRLLMASALTVLVGGGFVTATTPQTVAQAATKAQTKKTKAAKAKRAKAKKKTQAERKHFTASQWSQIKTYRQRAQQIGNSTKGMYAQKPKIHKTFNPGKLSSTYINRTVNWVNFYRTMFGLKQVTAAPAWNTSAQVGAATLAAANQGLSHGLVGFHRPAFVSATAWQQGADATAQSNLYQGLINPHDIVMGYLNDGHNVSGSNPGHRLWLLGGITQIGVGQAGMYNDLRVFDSNDDTATPAVKTVAYPRAGVMPYELVSGGAPWSVSYADDYDNDSQQQPKITVRDNTAKKAVSLSHKTISGESYGWFGTTVYFLPKRSQIKANHSYTVKISQIENQADVHYTTKLFKLKG